MLYEVITKNAFDRLAQNYEGNGGTALSMMSKSERIRILMVTTLGDSVCKTIGIEKISMDQVKFLVKQSTGSVAAIPNGGILVRTPG